MGIDAGAVDHLVQNHNRIPRLENLNIVVVAAGNHRRARLNPRMQRSPKVPIFRTSSGRFKAAWRRASRLFCPNSGSSGGAVFRPAGR